jgi:hypothetical protein
VSNKNQLTNFSTSVNSLFTADQINHILYEAVLGHRSMYHFSLDFHLFTHILIPLYRSVVSNKNQLTNFTTSVNSLFTAGTIQVSLAEKIFIKMIFSSWIEALVVHRERTCSDLDLEYMYVSGSWMMKYNKIACRVGTARKKKYILVYICASGFRSATERRSQIPFRHPRIFNILLYH